jgi:uncharacterized protein (TIGR02266 family)
VVAQRRAFPRVPLRAKVQMEFAEQRYFLSEWAVNLSPGGMFVRSEAELQPGQRFEFDAGLSPQGPRFNGVGEVLWTRRGWEGSSRPPGFAVRFLQLEEAGRLAIERLADVFLADGVVAMQAQLQVLAQAWQQSRLEEDQTGELPPFDDDELLPDTAVIDPPQPGEAGRADTTPLPVQRGALPAEELVAGGDATGVEPPRPEEALASTQPPGPQRRVSRGRGAWTVLLVLGVGAAGYLGWRATASSRSGQGDAAPAAARGAGAAAASADQPLLGSVAATELGDAFQTVRSVSWTEAPEGLWVVLALEGKLPADGYRRFRANQPPPREVLQLLGARRRFAQREMVVGSPLLQQIRFGFHPGEGGDELRVVLDLGSPEVGVRRIENDGDTLRLLLAEEGRAVSAATGAVAAPAPVVAPPAAPPG